MSPASSVTRLGDFHHSGYFWELTLFGPTGPEFRVTALLLAKNIATTQVWHSIWHLLGNFPKTWAIFQRKHLVTLQPPSDISIEMAFVQMSPGPTSPDRSVKCDRPGFRSRSEPHSMISLKGYSSHCRSAPLSNRREMKKPKWSKHGRFYFCRSPTTRVYRWSQLRCIRFEHYTQSMGAFIF